MLYSVQTLTLNHFQIREGVNSGNTSYYRLETAALVAKAAASLCILIREAAQHYHYL